MNINLININSKISNSGKLNILMDTNSLIDMIGNVETKEGLDSKLSSIFKSEYFKIFITRNVLNETLRNHVGKWSIEMESYFIEFIINLEGNLLYDFSLWSNVKKDDIDNDINIKDITDLSILSTVMENNITCLVTGDHDFSEDLIKNARKFTNYNGPLFIANSTQWKNEVNKIYTIIQLTYNSQIWWDIFKKMPEINIDKIIPISVTSKKCNVNNINGHTLFLEKNNDTITLKKISWDSKINISNYEKDSKAFIHDINFEYSISETGFHDVKHIKEIIDNGYLIMLMKDGYKQIIDNSKYWKPSYNSNFNEISLLDINFYINKSHDKIKLSDEDKITSKTVDVKSGYTIYDWVRILYCPKKKIF